MHVWLVRNVCIYCIYILYTSTRSKWQPCRDRVLPSGIVFHFLLVIFSKFKQQQEEEKKEKTFFVNSMRVTNYFPCFGCVIFRYTHTIAMFQAHSLTTIYVHVGNMGSHQAAKVEVLRKVRTGIYLYTTAVGCNLLFVAFASTVSFSLTSVLCRRRRCVLATEL